MFLYAFFHVSWPYSQHFDRTTFAAKETYPVELFLLLDPLVGLSTALAGRILNLPTLLWTFGILAFCMLVPRAFCGYLCPLGTTIDAFDWLIGRRLSRFHLADNGPKDGWVHTKYFLLALVLVSSLGGVLLAGYVSAIPVFTRGVLFTGGRVQLAWEKGVGNLPAADWTVVLSLVLFAAVFALGIFGRRFWCRYVCPSGALFSVLNWARVGERKVLSNCISCRKCVEICPFDAIHEDFTTRSQDCTWCQSCGGVCPSHSIQFVTRWHTQDLKPVGDPPVQPRPVSRRGFVAAAALAVGAAALTRGTTFGSGRDRPRPLRPPGSVPEDRFSDLCIRCGQCFVVCPGPVLRPAGLEYGLDALWTPVADTDHAGCHQDCNHCTQVCPTGAIQPLELETKRAIHMGLAKVDVQTCLPYRRDDRKACDLCYVECEAAGYHAIEMREIRIELDPPPPEGMFSDQEIEEMSRILAPHVDADACVGCGICQYRCYSRYVVQDKSLARSAIAVVPENEHRLLDFRGLRGRGPQRPDEVQPRDGRAS